MARVYKQQYTKPIPEGAERVKAKIKRHGKIKEVDAVRWKDADGKTITAPLVLTGKQAGTHCRIESPNWYGTVNGKPYCLETSNRKVAEVKLAAIISGVEEVPRQGKKLLVAPLVERYREYLTNKDRSPAYINNTIRHLERIIVDLQAEAIRDLDYPRVSEWLQSLRKNQPIPVLSVDQTAWTRKEISDLAGIGMPAVTSLIHHHELPGLGQGRSRVYPRATVEFILQTVRRGASPETVNHHIRSLRSFMSWLVRPMKLLTSNPLSDLKLLDTSKDRRHDRRVLSAEELQRLLDTTYESPHVRRGLSGIARSMLYLVACCTGFRASALAGLTPADFHLSHNPPMIVLPARLNKSKKLKRQPIPRDAVDQLQKFTSAFLPDEFLWPGRWAKDRKGGAMLRFDLRQAEIPYKVSGPDGPLFADFHALRHSYLTALGRSGVNMRTIQELAGHSTPVITARYMHVGLDEMSKAVDSLQTPYKADASKPKQS